MVRLRLIKHGIFLLAATLMENAPEGKKKLFWRRRGPAQIAWQRGWGGPGAVSEMAGLRIRDGGGPRQSASRR